MLNGYGQTKLKDTVYIKDSYGHTRVAILHKTKDGWYYYETNENDKYYYQQYLLLRKKHIPDSINPYYKLLMRKK